MRFIPTAIFLNALLVGLSGISPAFADNGVLLPSSVGTTSGGNLGLIPSTDNSTATTSTSSTSSSQYPQTTIPATNTLSTTTATTSTASTTTTGTAPTTATLTIPTTVIQRPAPTNDQATAQALINQVSGSVDPKYLAPLQQTLGANGMFIGISPKYFWGTNDLSFINSQFGIPTGKIPSLCTLSANGIMITSPVGTASSSTSANGVTVSNNTPYTFDTGYGLSTTISYNGQIIGLSGQIMAMCQMVMPLPANVGFIQQVGNRYAATLSSFNCAPTTPTPHSLVISYQGNSAVQCTYQNDTPRNNYQPQTSNVPSGAGIGGGGGNDGYRTEQQ